MGGRLHSPLRNKAGKTATHHPDRCTGGVSGGGGTGRRERKAAKDTPLVHTLGLAHYWQHLLDTGKVGSLTAIAAAEGMDLGQVSRIGRMARLAPWVVEAEGIALDGLLRMGMEWGGQCPSD